MQSPASIQTWEVIGRILFNIPLLAVALGPAEIENKMEWRRDSTEKQKCTRERTATRRGWKTWRRMGKEWHYWKRAGVKPVSSLADYLLSASLQEQWAQSQEEGNCLYPDSGIHSRAPPVVPGNHGLARFGSIKTWWVVEKLVSILCL